MPLFGRKKKKDVPQEENLKEPESVPIPQLFQDNDIDLGNYGSMTYVKPKGWPTIPISLAQSKEAVDKDIKTLQVMIESNGIGQVVFHQDIDTIDGRFPLPIHVRTPDGLLVPLFLQYEPFDQDEQGTIINIHIIRSSPEFRKSPFALYSRFPVPIGTAYHYSGVPEALFESHASVLLFRGSVDFPLMAVECQQLAREFLGVELDLSPDSLEGVDDILRRLHWTEDPPILKSTCMILGAYVGEVIRKNLGGDWVMKEGGRYPTLHKDGAITDPVSKVLKQISKQDGDEVAFYYKGIEVTY
jgi:hypothetical protein